MIENSGTPFEKVSVIYCNYHYYNSIHLTGLYTYELLLDFHDIMYLHNKIKKQHRKGTIWNNGYKH